MSAATGLGMLDVAILEACDAAGALATGEHIKTMRVLDALYEATGIGPHTTYEPLLDLARHWRAHLLLIDFHGNAGAPDFGAASPRYTECRLTPLGAAALDAEQGRIGPLPIALINGDAHAGGRRPPLDPGRVVQAIRAAATASDPELSAIIGLPRFPTLCEVLGDAHRFAAGESVVLTLRARILDQGRSSFAMDRLPPGSAVSEIANMIQRRVEMAKVGRAEPLAIRDIHNESAGDLTRLVFHLAPGAAMAEVRDQISEAWGVRRTMTVHLDRPLPQLVREFVSSGTDDLEGRLALITAATC
jgi:DNA gyrase/topoisomerase IV subunit A